MKTFRIISIVIATLVTLGGLPAASAQAATATGGNQYVVPITKYGKNINQPCKGDKNPMYKLVVSIAPGTDGNFVDGDRGVGIIQMQDGTPQVMTDYPVPTTSYFTNEFYWYAENGAQVDTTSPRNLVVVEGPGENMSLVTTKLKRLCQGYYGG